jgi:hypothetical protein
VLPIVRPRRRSIRAAAAPLLPLLLCALVLAAVTSGGGVRPAHARQGKKAPQTQVAEALEDFRRTAVVYPPRL